jgi:hypothetical protein
LLESKVVSPFILKNARLSVYKIKKLISLNLVLAGLRLGLKNCQVGEKWVSDDCSYLYKGLFKNNIIF